MWGEVSESKREKGRLGSREEGENRERQSPTLRWTETLHTWRDWERQREREKLKRQREKQLRGAERGKKKEGAWKRVSQKRQKQAGREMTAQGGLRQPSHTPRPALPTCYLTCQEII